MLNIAKRAISSMNYFFLRVAAGKESIETVDEELESFIRHLDSEWNVLPKDVVEDMRVELVEGDYFKDLDAPTVQQKLEQTIDKLHLNPAPNVVAFYMALYNQK